MAANDYITITAASLRRLKPQPRRYTKRDVDLVGFNVLVLPTGTVSLRAETRVADGSQKQRNKTLKSYPAGGQFNDAEVKSVRAEAMTLIGEWKGGTDPTVKVGELPTLQEVRDRYVDVRKVKNSTAADYQQLLDTHLAPWANRGVDTITPGDVKKLHEEIASPSRADASMRLLRALWNFAWADNVDDTGESRLRGKNPVDVLTGLGQWNGNKPKSSHIPKAAYKAWYAAVILQRIEQRAIPVVTPHRQTDLRGCQREQQQGCPARLAFAANSSTVPRVGGDDGRGACVMLAPGTRWLGYSSVFLRCCIRVSSAFLSVRVSTPLSPSHPRSADPAVQ